MTRTLADSSPRATSSRVRTLIGPELDPRTVRIRAVLPEDAAEVAIAVADAWQGHGIGHRLMVAGLDWAKTSGIATLTATMFADNAAIHHLLLGLGLRTQSRFVTGGVSEVRIDLGAEHSQPTAA